MSRLTLDISGEKKHLISSRMTLALEVLLIFSPFLTLHYTTVPWCHDATMPWCHDANLCKFWPMIFIQLQSGGNTTWVQTNIHAWNGIVKVVALTWSHRAAWLGGGSGYHGIQRDLPVHDDRDHCHLTRLTKGVRYVISNYWGSVWVGP